MIRAYGTTSLTCTIIDSLAFWHSLSLRVFDIFVKNRLSTIKKPPYIKAPKICIILNNKNVII
jgi:hypothetical protein